MKPTLLECVDPDKTVKLVSCDLDDSALQADTGPRVFVLGDRRANKVRRLLSDLLDLQPKHKDTQPARVFGNLKPGQRGIYKRAFKSTDQLPRSVRTLLRRLQEQHLDVACFVQVPDDVFSALLDETDVYESDRQNAPPQSHAARMIALANDTLQDVSMPESLRNKYVGNAECVERVRQMIWKVSEFSDPVIITGESGTGKEIIARCIHECGEDRGRGPVFNPINCGAVQAKLFESELFGHAKYAFTDARDKRVGLWEAAGDGTLFLDEIADLERSNQAKMLRALESKKVRPVGSNKEVKVSARIISATNRDLHSMMRYGTFRSDLYYRLNTFWIVAPPLREHIEDIGVISQFLWKKIVGASAPPLPDEVLDPLANYDWPGNVRELHGVITVLHTWHGEKIDSREQVKMAMFVHANPAAIFSSNGTEPMSASVRLAATMRKLKSADRALGDAHHFFETPGGIRAMVRDNNAAILSALDDRRCELVDLTKSPLLLGSSECFDAVHEATGKIAYLLDSLHADAANHSAHEQRDIQKTILHARELVSAQIESVLAQVRS